ncbi:MAG TPA: SAM-dependent methyltransferase [Acetobacteraceae bacterium]|jgi:SAM-dependent methyltransferase|nr:SAM-dependent methyltransferase [Acetobacteraceae bacterium]
MGLSDPAASMLATRDRYFVPCVMAPFAEDLARRLGRLTNGPVLEIAADTGALTLAMAASLSAGLTIIATDPDPAAIEHASAKSGMARVTWQTAEPQALPFQDATFGVVACLFAAATLPDRVATFQEVRRVMKRGARFLFSVPGHIRQNPVADCIHAALETLSPGDPPSFIGHGLHGYGDSETIDDDLTEAGFTDAIYTAVDLPFAADSAREVAMGYCLGTPLRAEIQRRFPHGTDSVTQALEKRFGTGKIKATMRAQVVSAAG